MDILLGSKLMYGIITEGKWVSEQGVLLVVFLSSFFAP